MDPASLHELRPRTLSELLDLSFRVYRRGFPLFARIGVLVSLLLVVLEIAWQLVLFRSMGGGADPDPFAMMLVFLPGTYGLLVGTSLLTSLGVMVVAVATDDLVQDRARVLGSVLSRAAPRVLPTLWTGLLTTIPVTFGMCLCCVPGVVLFVLFVLAVPIVYLEGTSGLQAIRRSIELVASRGPGGLTSEVNWVRVLVIGLISLLTMYALNALTTAPILALTAVQTARGGQPYMTPLGPQPVPLWAYLPIRVIAALAEGLLLPISMIPWPLVYLDIRVRHEGLDIERRLLAMDPAAFGAGGL